MIKIKKLTTLIAFLLISVLSFGQDKANKRPNVILIMTDDQGYGDIAAHGNPIIKTPNLDKLYAESVRFTDFYVNAFCAPTRAALMTGRMSDRTHVTTTINLRNHLSREETTMAEFFKASGYQTALFGKWHLGGNYPFRPMDRGFDQWVGHGDGGTATSSDYWGNDRMNDTYFRNGEWEKFEGFGTDVYFNETNKFIKIHKDEPFFVYLPTNVPHDPWNVVKEWRKQYDNPDFNLTESEKDFYATITYFDKKLGELREFLRINKLDDNTILIFLTDNGTARGYNIFNAGMKGHKGTPYQGGHRVPLFIHWPNGGLKKGVDVDKFTTHTDILPTLIDVCKLKTPERGHLKFDGRSLSPLLFEKNATWADRTFIIHLQNLREVPVKGVNSMVATSKWRFINGKELYDIKADSGENKNVIKLYPEVVKELTKKYNEHWDEMQPGYYTYPRVIVGAKQCPETWLTSDAMVPDHARAKTAMQSYVLNGEKCGGFWPIEVEAKGTYEFDVRRWPKELNHPLSAGLPKASNSDISSRGEPLFMEEGRALDVAKVVLRVGGTEKEYVVSPEDVCAKFKIPLEEGPNIVRAWLIDSKGNEGGAYQVYVTKEN